MIQKEVLYWLERPHETREGISAASRQQPVDPRRCKGIGWRSDDCKLATLLPLGSLISDCPDATSLCMGCLGRVGMDELLLTLSRADIARQ